MLAPVNNPYSPRPGESYALGPTATVRLIRLWHRLGPVDEQELEAALDTSGAAQTITVTHCPHGVLVVPSCSGHGRFLCSVGHGHVCLPDPCEECTRG